MDTVPTNPPRGREIVLLTHGIASSKWIMMPLARRLEHAGFATRLWGYSSILSPIERNGRRLAKKLRMLSGSGRWDRIHIVAHSMGSIVTRCALYEFGNDPPARFGRVVMLGPPNGGSHMATKLTPIYGWFSRPLVQLRDTRESFVNRLPAPPEWAEFGVLAAAKDNVIHLERTHLAGERDHHVINSWHTGMVWQKETAARCAAFLRTGRFNAGVGDNRGEQLTPGGRPPSRVAG